MQSIGDGDDTVESSSKEIMQTEEGFAPVFFDPRPLTNLLLIDELESLSPVLDMQVNLLLDYSAPTSFQLCTKTLICSFTRSLTRSVVLDSSVPNPFHTLNKSIPSSFHSSTVLFDCLHTVIALTVCSSACIIELHNATQVLDLRLRSELLACCTLLKL